MSYDLCSQSTAVCRKFSSQFWVKSLELARFYGWQPSGTHPPSCFDSQALNADWHGGYLTNDGQMITTKDALSLATALEKSLDDIPDDNIRIDWKVESWMEDDLPEWLSPAERQTKLTGIVFMLSKK